MADHDCLVIGAGVAGLTAAADLARGGARVLLVERLMSGGQVATIEEIRNFPGHAVIAGYEIGPLLQEAAEEAGAEIRLGEVTRLVADGADWRVDLDGESLTARAVVLAMGSHRRKLGVAREAALTGFGVSHCASCDGGFFAGQHVVVAGGGDSAFDEALILAGQAARVTVVCDPEPTARAEAQAALAACGTVTILPRHRITAIEGGTQVAGVRVQAASGAEVPLPCEGVFVYVGLDPATGFLPAEIARDSAGRVMVDDRLAGSAAGIFAAGDLRQGSAAMLWQAQADGQRAAASALAYLRGQAS